MDNKNQPAEIYGWAAVERKNSWEFLDFKPISPKSALDKIKSAIQLTLTD